MAKAEEESKKVVAVEEKEGRGVMPIPLLTPYKMAKFNLSHSVGTVNKIEVLQLRASAPRCSLLFSKNNKGWLLDWGSLRGVQHSTGPDGQAPISCTNKPVQKDIAHSAAKYPPPRPLRTDEIPKVVNDFTIAAKNAIEAGFDGVEIHGANGYLLDQFLKDKVNDRDDEYGGNLENRCRFPLQVVKAIADEIGGDRVGARLSPFADYNDCGDSDPEALAIHMAQSLNQLGILYCHVIEPRMVTQFHRFDTKWSLLPMRKAFNRTFIVAGGYDRNEGNQAIASGAADLVAYGRLFLANPDLPRRFELDAELNKPDRSTFYTHDPVVGYTDYPLLQENTS